MAPYKHTPICADSSLCLLDDKQHQLYALEVRRAVQEEYEVQLAEAGLSKGLFCK